MSDFQLLTFPTSEGHGGSFTDALRAIAAAIDRGEIAQPKNGVLVLEGAMAGTVNAYAVGNGDPIRGVGLLHAAATVLLFTSLRATESI